MKRHSAMDKHSGLISVHQPNTQITSLLARKPRMFIHWVISFRILLTDVQNNPVFASLFKSFSISAQRSDTETRSLKGSVQLFLISEIYTITTENPRPRYFSAVYSGRFSGNMSHRSPEQEPRSGRSSVGVFLSPSSGIDAQVVSFPGLRFLS